MFQLLTNLAFAGIAAASYASNINYRSPSHNHPGLGVSIHKVNRRNAGSPPLNATGLVFTHGVASGDPYLNSVIIWTRCAPTQDDVNDNSTVSGYMPLYNPVPIYYQTGAAPPSTAPVCLSYKVASDNAFLHVVGSGSAYTSSDVDYTLKTLIKADRGPKSQPVNILLLSSCIGRTKTTPAPNDLVTKIGLAVYSCSNFPFGFFNAFGNPARKDSVDYVLHLGDYIYEYKNGDYEVADNTYRDGESELNNTEASFISDGGISVDQRKMNAVRAYFEWMPIRQVEMDDILRIWRSFSIGSLLDLIILDTRHYDRSITDLYWNTRYVHQISNDAGRSMMGSRQESWFYSQLISSAKRAATWRVVGSQTVFSRINESIAYGNVDPLDYDAWDGYQANRNRTFQTLYDNNIGNIIAISGDSHANWVSDLVWLDEHPYDPTTGNGSIGVDFAGTAVSSPSPYGQNITLVAANNASNSLVQYNRELQWSEIYYGGYFELQISQDSVNARYFGMPTIVNRNPDEINLANFTVLNGSNA
ncbi:hypothetical protein MMC28_011711 [Mycoblastus sanguinarius]|nr:hypothetical protein [Mycoblastus sanguinarius]